MTKRKKLPTLGIVPCHKCRKEIAWMSDDNDPPTCEECSVVYIKLDDVNHPQHYMLGEIEAKDIIKFIINKMDALTNWEAYCMGAALAYWFRAGKKGDAEKDYAKAKVYFDWARENLK